MKKSIKLLMVFYLVCIVFYPVSVHAASVIRMNPGQEKTLKAPKDYRAVTWKSSKKAVLTVTKHGKVKAAGTGTAVVTAKSGKKSKKYTVKVQKVQLSPKNLTLEEGQTASLTVKQVFGKVSWSSNSDAVNVNKQGKITAIKQGEATITANVFGKAYSCKVIVKVKNTENADKKMKVQIGDHVFTATLEQNSSVDAFVEMMKENPVVIHMRDYAGFEKVGSLGTILPTKDRYLTTQAGDIVLYNGNQIVMFYGSNSWSYTKIGRIDDLTGWKEALGDGAVTVVFSVEK